MNKIIMIMIAGVILVSVNAFAVGGILPTGTGTNIAVGDIKANASESLRGFGTVNVNGSGVTNIPAAGVQGTAVVGTDIGSTVQAYDADLDTLALNNGSELTNIAPAGVVGTAVVGTDIGSTVQAHSANLDTLALNDGGSLTNITADAPGDMLSTNDTPQSKAGLLTLTGGATIGQKLTLTPSATQTLTNGANVAIDAAIVAVAGDVGAVTCGMADGSAAGQLLTIRGTHTVNTVTLTNAAVVPTFMLGENDVISFVWSGSVWVEIARRDN